MNSPSISPSMSQPSQSYPAQFAMTTTGLILPTITGTLSTISSLIILNIIRMSPQKLSTTYHRIMALMSIFDIMASVCMALTTLPMPSDDVLRFDGPMIGNKTTCQIQGYILLMGLTGGGSLYMCLSWYFVCRMTFKMDSEKIRKKIEPIFYMYCISLALFLPSSNVYSDMINTVPNEQFCLIASVHTNCTYTADGILQSCEFSNIDASTYDVFRLLLGFNLLMIVLAMVVIIWSISKNNKSIKRALEAEVTDTTGPNTSQEENEEVSLSKLRYSRVVVIQALMYIMTYFLTWIFPFLSNLLGFDRNVPDIIMIGKAILFPMQGLWNLIIFLYDKAYLIYQNGEGQGSLWDAMTLILLDPDAATGIVLPTSLVHRDMDSLEDSHRVNDISNHDFEIPSIGFDSFRHDIDASQAFHIRRHGTRGTSELDISHSREEIHDSIDSPVGFAGSMISTSLP
jgi:hypothetical protein